MGETDFNSILESHEKMIFHIIHKLGIRDVEQEFYQEGIIALWHATETYDPRRGKFSTYAYYLIHKALINLIQKNNNRALKDEKCVNQLSQETMQTTLDVLPAFDHYMLQTIEQTLTEKQMKWFQLFILEDLSVKEIADREGVTIDTVKNWGRLAKQKLRKVLTNQL